MRPCPWFYSLPLFIFRQSVNVKQRACEIIQRQWTRDMVTNLCHWHCDLCRQFVTHEPGDLCDITEKNIAEIKRWDSERSNSGPHSRAAWWPRVSSLPNTAHPAADGRAALLPIAVVAFSLLSLEIFPGTWMSKFASSWSLSFSKKIIKLTRREGRTPFRS